MAGETRFEWDRRKSEANRGKHGLTFETAVQVFADPLKSIDLEGDEHGEIRWRATGEIGGTLHVVSYTIRKKNQEEIIRIISARKATPRERETFEETP